MSETDDSGRVDEKVVVIRDGQATTEGLVLAAAIYMGAVKDIFALRSDGPPYNERKVTKDVAALRAFDHLDSATKALRSAISHFAPDAEPVAQFVETYWTQHRNGEVSFTRRPWAEFPEWVLESNTYDVFRSSPPIDAPDSKR